MPLNDMEIARLCRGSDPMISPFVDKSEGSPSFGLSSFGYDIRLGPEFKYFSLVRNHDPHSRPRMIDPRAFDPGMVHTCMAVGDSVSIAPHGFMLAASLERFNIPSDIMAVCVSKSTYARCGLIVNVTPLEPGWKGQLTLEINNTTDHHVKMYIGMGICQLLFFRGDRPSVTYADRHGKYQDQQGVTLAR